MQLHFGDNVSLGVHTHLLQSIALSLEPLLVSHMRVSRFLNRLL